MTSIIDLRSDTVTLPTPAMRDAMAQAEVGDDVHGEDPTVQRLERMSADLMGKEAAVYVASGTMGNLASLLSHCGRGDEAIVGSEAHVLHYEAGGVTALGSVELRTVPNDDHGMLDLAAVEEAIRPDNVHAPRTAVICLENTHNRCGGGVLTVDEMAQVSALAREYGIVVHLDGARIFNAAIALGVPAAALAQHADSVTFCFSKGL
ncbi:MAG: aminotransferase class I/II-fold pyridoxal phosphate-dependent enzyme, partial [Chloroflexi bacterium]|nr:aminotransferase class I/II-fold pyridoxal phosphate-dependent enzyme [Chloroflexota bacterium]